MGKAQGATAYCWGAWLAGAALTLTLKIMPCRGCKGGKGGHTTYVFGKIAKHIVWFHSATVRLFSDLVWHQELRRRRQHWQDSTEA